MRYFSIDELCRSDTARTRRIDNTPTPQVKASLEALVDNVLDPLREAWGKPITVTSGYRSPALNKAVGGVSTSQHLKGEAADITTGNYVDNARLFQLAVDLKLPFDQIIFEKGDIKTGPAWIHVSHRPNPRKQILYLK